MRGYQGALKCPGNTKLMCQDAINTSDKGIKGPDGDDNQPKSFYIVIISVNHRVHFTHGVVYSKLNSNYMFTICSIYMQSVILLGMYIY